MDPRLEQAAESGSIDELYALIDENPYILENIEAVPFVTTPLHVAAASGNLPFAKEIMNLKPSFARKLNAGGYSPLHLAVNMDQDEFVCRMIWLDGHLARVKGRNGITPFHLLAIKGDADLVARCLRKSPECIEDESVDRQNALHLAVIHNRFEVLQVLTGWIQRMTQRDADSIQSRVLNKVDIDYNMPLHLAASKNDRQAVKLLLECRLVKRNEVNGDGLTFLDILRNQEQREEEGGAGLRSQGPGGEDLDLEQVVVKTGCKEAASVPRTKARFETLKSPFTFWNFCSTGIRRLRTDTSDEARGVFLIICTLIITATYQTALQPPGGVHQSEGSNAGSVVMKQVFFILLWISNTIGFCCAIFYTFCLMPIGSMFACWFFWIGGSLCISYALAMAVISPHPLVFLSAAFVFFLLIALYMLLEVFFESWHLTVSLVPRLSWFWKV
ncbi:Ankyrin repeat family protein [Raphanus sativus]|uniref:Ankyrin repeat-containing protein BDA1-like n=2 Tax=Raphanus sativus TaxID=3726 RepID=A0A6J0NXY9_RAPSA|nr:ankyrin repeat-containing protein BDA1-like [Raphanus sativus]KAJ4915774.1 Ankyrin repeat family protein [Raphanus sativus]